jgi:hypothetical protein
MQTAAGADGALDLPARNAPPLTPVDIYIVIR